MIIQQTTVNTIWLLLIFLFWLEIWRASMLHWGSCQRTKERPCPAVKKDFKESVFYGLYTACAISHDIHTKSLSMHHKVVCCLRAQEPYYDIICHWKLLSNTGKNWLSFKKLKLVRKKCFIGKLGIWSWLIYRLRNLFFISHKR